jgi:hypothetical protein
VVGLPSAPVDETVARTAREVIDAVREAAGAPLEAGAAELSMSTVKELYGADADYDAPVVVLAPRNEAAARVTIEVQHGEVWWLQGADGPGFEFYAGMREDRYALVRTLVRAVIAGEYEYGWEQRHQRLLLRPWRRRSVSVRVARFGSQPEPITTEHWIGAEGRDPGYHRFEPYY